MAVIIVFFSKIHCYFCYSKTHLYLVAFTETDYKTNQLSIVKVVPSQITIVTIKNFGWD